MRERIRRHEDRDDVEQPGRNRPNMRLCVVNMRNNRRKQRQHRAHNQVRSNRQQHQPPCAVFCTLDIVCAKRLPDHNRHRQEHDLKQVADGRSDVACRHNIQPADGIALQQNRHARRPEEFIDQQRHTAHKHVFEQRHRHAQFAISTQYERKTARLGMRIDDDNRRFDIAGKHRCNGSTRHAQLRKTAFAENQEVVKDQID